MDIGSETCYGLPVACRSCGAIGHGASPTLFAEATVLGLEICGWIVLAGLGSQHRLL